MKPTFIFCIAATCAVANTSLADPTVADLWLAKTELAPPFVVPAGRDAWEAKRLEIRADLWKMLGELPPRPKTPRVEILSSEDRGAYVVEKFRFDNEAGSMVPGCLLIPKKGPCKAACHPLLPLARRRITTRQGVELFQAKTHSGTTGPSVC